MKLFRITLYSYLVGALPKLFVYALCLVLVYVVKQLPYFNIFLSWSYVLLFIWLVGVLLFKPTYKVLLGITIMVFLTGGVIQILTGNELARDFVSAGYYMSVITMTIRILKAV